MKIIKGADIIYYKDSHDEWMAWTLESEGNKTLRRKIEDRSNYWNKDYLCKREPRINSIYGNVSRLFFYRIDNPRNGCQFRYLYSEVGSHFTGNYSSMACSRANLTARKALPKLSGCYAMFDADNSCLYIGRSKNINRRVDDHMSDCNYWRDKVQKILVWPSQECICDARFEIFLVACLKPSANAHYSSDKLNKYCNPIALLKVM